jgi:uncharacterized membrane protein (UPF0127 family)/CheY-like chemotaxis protein
MVRHRHGSLTLRREDGRIVCERVKVADTWFRRMRGLLFRRSVKSEEGVVLRPSFSIHTAFIRFPIDVVFLDQDLRVLRIAACVRPFRTASCRGSREAVELRAGECERRGLVVGDRVAWASTTLSAPVNVAAAEPSPLEQTRRHALVASRDARFVKLVRFLLDGRGIDVIGSVPPNALLDTLDSADEPDLIVLDVHEEAAAGLATANAARALSGGVPIFLVGAPDVAARAAPGLRIYDKWNETEDLILAITTALDAEAAPESPPSSTRRPV